MLASKSIPAVATAVRAFISASCPDHRIGSIDARL